MNTIMILIVLIVLLIVNNTSSFSTSSIRIIKVNRISNKLSNRLVMNNETPPSSSSTALSAASVSALANPKSTPSMQKTIKKLLPLG